MAASRGIVTGPQPTDSARRFAARLRLYVALTRAVRGFDLSDALMLVSLVFVFIGLAAPSAAFAVVGFLLLPLTPVWASIRIMLRGR
jgi:hypothetical protein